MEGAHFVEELEKEWCCLLSINLRARWAGRLERHRGHGKVGEYEVVSLSVVHCFQWQLCSVVIAVVEPGEHACRSLVRANVPRFLRWCLLAALRLRMRLDLRSLEHKNRLIPTICTGFVFQFQCFFGIEIDERFTYCSGKL